MTSPHHRIIFNHIHKSYRASLVPHADNIVPGHDAAELKICPDEPHSDGDMRHADAVESVR